MADLDRARGSESGSLDSSPGDSDRTLFWALVAYGAVAALLVFVLPWAFPPVSPVRADSYAAGFDNRLAIGGLLVALALGTAATLLRSEAGRRGEGAGLLPRGGREVRLSRQLLGGTAALYLLLHLGLLSLLAGRYFSDSAYFLRRLALVGRYGLDPYRDFEFAYGPLLLLPGAWLHDLLQPLRLSLATAYYLHFLLFSLLGLWLLWRFVDLGGGPLRARRIVFLLAALATFETGLGLNYTLPRFLLPVLGLLFLDSWERQAAARPVSRLMAAYFWRDLAMSVLAFALSPEMGVVFSLAALIRIPVAAWARRRALLWLLLPWAAVRVSLVLLLPTGYSEVYRAFAAGGYNIPAYPAPHLLLYTAALLWLIPLGLLQVWRRDPALAPGTAGVVALTVLLIPGALGRSDPGHVLGYGLVPLLWALLTLARRSPRRFRLAAAAFALVFVVGAQGVTLFHHRGVLARAAWEQWGTRWLAAADVRRVAAALALDPDKVERALRRPERGREPPGVVVRFPHLAAPLPLPEEMGGLLEEHTAWRATYFVDNLNLVTPEQVQRLLAELEEQPRLVAPAEVLRPGALRPEIPRIRRVLGQRLLFPVWYPRRREPYSPEEELAAAMRAGWQVVAEEGGIVILEPRAAGKG